jgi:hypothetical protein
MTVNCARCGVPVDPDEGLETTDAHSVKIVVHRNLLVCAGKSGAC